MTMVDTPEHNMKVSGGMQHASAITRKLLKGIKVYAFKV
jgi:hypothetical protein